MTSDSKSSALSARHLEENTSNVLQLKNGSKPRVLGWRFQGCLVRRWAVGASGCGGACGAIGHGW